MTLPAPDTSVETREDAKDRSIRTVLQGLGLDVLVAIVLVLATAVSNIEWTAEYWAALGLLAAKSVIQAGVSYLMRLYVKPKTEG